MVRIRVRSYIVTHFCVLLLALALHGRAAAQAAAEPTPKTTKETPKTTKKKTKSTGSKSANVKTGQIVSIDPEGLKISLKTGAETSNYTLAETTRYLKAKQEVQADSFKVGDSVVLKLRKVRGKPAYFVFELADEASYNWLTDLRKAAKTGTVKEIGEDTLVAAIENHDVTYTISEKTRWNRPGKEVSATAFKAGDIITVIPRALPGGNIMARVVADTPKDAELSKAEGAGILTGVFKSLDTDKKTVTFVMEGDESRTLPYDSDTEIRIRTKKASLSALKSGQRIVVHLNRADDGKESAARIMIELTTRKATKKP